MPSTREVPLERLGWVVLLVGGSAAAISAGLEPSAARSAAGQDWPPFVLVAGLLLIGMVARDEGIFDRAGAVLGFGRSGMTLLMATAVVVALVTVTLNLDTAVTFLTPVVLAAARHRRRDPEPFLYLVVAMANGSSLLLPGSNLTNLIVLHDTHQSGASYVARIGPAWAASTVAVIVVVVVLHRRRINGRLLEHDGAPVATSSRPVPATLGILVAVVAMLALPAYVAALVVAADGLVLTLTYGPAGSRGEALNRIRHLNAPLLAGLFGTALALGVLGRVWSGPAKLVAHAGLWQTAGIGAIAAVVLNNLPAASLLAARPLPHPSALLVGLNLGPNLWLYASLAGVLWFQSARGAGWTPSVRRFSLFGLAMVPVTMAAALGALTAAH